MLMAGVTKRSTRMADGRELVYYDDADTTLPVDRDPDLRDLDARSTTPTMRQDPLTGEWVSIAAARQHRVLLPGTDRDPLAPATADNPSEVPSAYDVVVFENRSPAFGPDLGMPDLTTIGIGRTAPAVGRCEVLSFGPEPGSSFAALPPSRVRTIVEAWADRTEVLSALPGVAQVFPFENRGEAIGVTLHHPHGQLYAYPYVTPRTRSVLAAVERQGPDLFQRILDAEHTDERVVLAGEHWTAFVPFAARWPLEVHLMPHRHIPDLAATDDAERAELARLYPRLVAGFDALYDLPTPYIAAWHQAPVHEGRDGVRLMLQLSSPRRAADRLKYLAGSEAAMGAWIGDVMPEQAAHLIRDGIARA